MWQPVLAAVRDLGIEGKDVHDHVADPTMLRDFLRREAGLNDVPPLLATKLHRLLATASRLDLASLADIDCYQLVAAAVLYEPVPDVFRDVFRRMWPVRYSSTLMPPSGATMTPRAGATRSGAPLRGRTRSQWCLGAVVWSRMTGRG